MTDAAAGQLGELGFYTLAGHTDSPARPRRRGPPGRGARARHRLHLGAVQRQGRARRCRGAAGRGQRPHRHRHRRHQPQHPPPDGHRHVRHHDAPPDRRPLRARASAAASTRCSGRIGLPPITTAQLEDFAGAPAPAVAGRDGHRPRRPGRDVPVPAAATARSTRTSRCCSSPSGPKTLELAGRLRRRRRAAHVLRRRDGGATRVAAVRRGAEQAGRDPRRGAGLVGAGHRRRPHPRGRAAEEDVGRLATYLQGYGDLLVRRNGWDPAVLERFRADPFVQGFRGASTPSPRPSELEHLATLIPDEWLAAVGHGDARAVRGRGRRPVRPRRRRRRSSTAPRPPSWRRSSPPTGRCGRPRRRRCR